LRRVAKQRALIVEPAAAEAAAALRRCLERAEQITPRFLAWPELHDDSWLEFPEDILILVAGSELEATSELLSRCRGLARKPILCVLPEQVAEHHFRHISGGSDDVVFAPVAPVELEYRVRRLLGEPKREPDVVRQRLLEELGLTQLVGRDPNFLRAVAQVPRFARSDLPVLVLGETGTGKELCARALHELGRRHARPFVAVDCGALPDSLFENEMFGHSRGAYTGADREQRGLVSIADGGTLFIDEVDALSLAAQAKLLRLLQEKTYRALGSDQQQRTDVRVIAATNKDLASLVDEKRFRSDLYFRLNVLRLSLPALRQRPDDIGLLAAHLLQGALGLAGSAEKSFGPDALRALCSHDWPGNIRELSNVVQRASVACDGKLILPSHLDLHDEPVCDAQPNASEFREARALAVAEFERRYVESLLRKHGGNVTHAAREAQQDRRAFGRYVKKYKIDRRAL
jgi:two-component system response regulator GlrR